MTHRTRIFHVWDNANALVMRAVEAKENSETLRKRAAQLLTTARELHLKLHELDRHTNCLKAVATHREN